MMRYQTHDNDLMSVGGLLCGVIPAQLDLRSFRLHDYLRRHSTLLYIRCKFITQA